MITLPPTGLSEATLFPWIIWYLWSAGNKLAFEEVRITEWEVVTQAIKEAAVWQTAHQRKSSPTNKPPDCKFFPSKPSLKQTKCFVDAAWIAATNKGGFGWIFTDPITGSSRSIGLYDCFETLSTAINRYQPQKLRLRVPGGSFTTTTKSY
ncbi:hypothetical protein F2Q70_00044673 [Brassica cretica]|uniref:Uncharacterized protein n=1 Tax=Brassica cretica TaxID=69181 RepID=A0A8S9KI39_BRACR|nr:hypothetical protein F2Q70_00044673 [Brassica cretica]